MKKQFYLTAPLVVLALVVSGCGESAPTSSSANEIVPKIDAPVVSSVDDVGPQLVGGMPGEAPGNCCPEGFDIQFEPGNPADLNGDSRVCRKVTVGGTITIDNNTPGDCVSTCPPNCGGA